MKKICLFLIFVLVSCTNQLGEDQAGTILPPPSSHDKAKISWSSIGPGGGGRLTSLAFAPPNTIYAGSDVGGIFRSFNGGKTFEIVNNGLQNYVVLTSQV